jgi:pimeloyl-ACP methyl ester carboxylesterase
MPTLECFEVPSSLYDQARFAVLGAGSDRVRVCFVELGASPGAALESDKRQSRVLLIHGNPSHLDHWAPAAQGLRQHATVLAYDQPGLGRSDDFDDARHTLERSVALAVALLDHVGWSEPVDVVGQSHGGLIAIALAARAPERVRSVALLGTGGTPAHLAYRLLALPGIDHLLPRVASLIFRAQSLAPFAARAVRLSASDSFSPEPVPAAIVAEEVALLSARPMLLQTMARLAQDAPCDKVVTYARDVKAPMLFIHGRDDGLVAISYARRLFDVMQQSGRDARFIEVDGGHMVHFTRPLLINPLLDDWLAAPR